MVIDPPIKDFLAQCPQDNYLRRMVTNACRLEGLRTVSDLVWLMETDGMKRYHRIGGQTIFVAQQLLRKFGFVVQLGSYGQAKLNVYLATQKVKRRH